MYSGDNCPEYHGSDVDARKEMSYRAAKSWITENLSFYFASADIFIHFSWNEKGSRSCLYLSTQYHAFLVFWLC
jgi:hypothetical protein